MRKGNMRKGIGYSNKHGHSVNLHLPAGGGLQQQGVGEGAAVEAAQLEEEAAAPAVEEVPARGACWPQFGVGVRLTLSKRHAACTRVERVARKALSLAEQNPASRPCREVNAMPTSMRTHPHLRHARRHA